MTVTNKYTKSVCHYVSVVSVGILVTYIDNYTVNTVYLLTFLNLCISIKLNLFVK